MNKSTLRRRALCGVTVLCLASLATLNPASAAIYRWDNGQLITDKNAVPDADLSNMDLGYADLVGANLSHADFRESDVSLGHLMQASLYDADFTGATLAGADFTDAQVGGANLSATTTPGRFNAGQLYSTADYQAKTLPNIQLAENDLTAWSFSGIDLSHANLLSADLTNAGLSGTTLLCVANIYGAIAG